MRVRHRAIERLYWYFGSLYDPGPPSKDGNRCWIDEAVSGKRPRELLLLLKPFTMQTSVFNLIRLAASYGFCCCLWYDTGMLLPYCWLFVFWNCSSCSRFDIWDLFLSCQIDFSAQPWQLRFAAFRYLAAVILHITMCRPFSIRTSGNTAQKQSLLTFRDAAISEAFQPRSADPSKHLSPSECP